MSLYIALTPPPPPPPKPPEPEPPLPEVGNANCYDFSSGDVVDVDSMTELVAAVNNAPDSGRQVRVAPGTYAGKQLTLSRAGPRPVVVRPREGSQSVTITDPVWTLAPGSSWIVLAGLQITNPEISVNGAHHRITRCAMRDIGRVAIHLYAATDFRADHCDWSGARSDIRRKAFVRLDGSSVGKKLCQRILVDHNYIHHSIPTIGSNGSEIIGLHSSSNSAWVDPGFVIEHNLFQELALPEDGELIGAKCSGIKYRYNTMLNTKNPYINAPRQAGGMEVRSNWFQGTNSSPLRVFAKSLVIGNRLMGSLTCWICAGDFYWSGKVETGYPAADGCRVIGNRVSDGYIRVGEYRRGLTPKVPARGNNLWGNTRDAGNPAYILSPGQQVDTTVKPDDEPYKPAVKLAPNDVGVAARDPMCPKGPQS